MRKFLLGSTIMLIALIMYIGYQQGIFFGKSLPLDEEQAGLSKQITIHFSHVVAENTPKGVAAQHFANLVEKKSNGSIQVNVYPNGILYNDDNEFEALQNNDVQMIAPTTSKMTDYLPTWELFDLPFLINTEEQLKIALSGETAANLLKELQKYNIKGLAFWSNGFKHMTSHDKPLILPNDFENLKIRTMSSELLERQFTLLGAKSLPSSFSEVYSDLAQNKIDAQENTISNIYSKGFYTVQNHLTLSYHGVLNYAVMVNDEFWNSLNTRQQQIITEAMEETNEWQFEKSQKMNKEDLEKLQQSSAITIHTLTEEQLAEWKKRLAPNYDYYQQHINSFYIEKLTNEINSNQ